MLYIIFSLTFESNEVRKNMYCMKISTFAVVEFGLLEGLLRYDESLILQRILELPPMKLVKTKKNRNEQIYTCLVPTDIFKKSLASKLPTTETCTV